MNWRGTAWVLLLAALAGPPVAHAQVRPALPPVPDSLRAAWQAAPPGTPGHAEVLLRIERAYVEPFDSAGVVGYARAAVQLARQTGQPRLAGLALDELGNFYRQQADLPHALACLRQAGPLLATAPTGEQAQYRYHLGMVYGDFNQPARALALYREAYLLAGTDQNLRADILNSRGLQFLFHNRLDSATTNLYRAARLDHELGDRGSEAAALCNLSSLLGQQQRWADALAYARRAKALEASISDTMAMSSSWRYIGNAQRHLDSTQAALASLHTALRMQLQTRLTGELPATWKDLALTYEQAGRPDSARYYFGRILALRQRTGRPTQVSIALQSLAEFYLRQRQWAVAEATARRVLAVPPAQADALARAGALDVLHRTAAHRQDFAAAYAWQTQARHLRDSLRVLADNQVVSEQRIRYETDQAETRVRELTHGQQVADLRHQRQLLGLLLAAVLLLAGGLVALLDYRRRRLRRELDLRTRISADLHDEVGGLLTQVSMQADLLGAVVQAPAQQVAQLHEVAATSRLAATQLQDVVWGFDARNDHVGSLHDRLRDYAYETLQYRDLTIAFEANEGSAGRPLSPEVRRALYLIFKEALHNITKHAPAGAHVRAALHETGHHLTLAISDDGPPPTRPTRASGHGLHNMQARAEAVGGSCATGFGAVPGQAGFGVYVVV